jgi:hypothetical protein
MGRKGALKQGFAQRLTLQALCKSPFTIAGLAILVVINLYLLVRYTTHDNPAHEILDDLMVKVEEYTKAQKELFSKKTSSFVVSENMMYTKRGLVATGRLIKLDEGFVAGISTVLGQLKAHMEIPGNRLASKNQEILDSELWTNLKYLSDSYRDKTLEDLEYTPQIRDLLRLIRQKVEYLDVS